MSPALQPKVSELSGRRVMLTNAYAKTFQLDLLAYKRLENDLKALVKIPEFESLARLELGVMSGLKRDFPEAVRNFSRAKQLGLNDADILCSYAVSALYCGEVEKAAELLLSAPMNGDPTYLRVVRSMAVQSGLFSLAVECTEKIIALKSDPAAGLSFENNPEYVSDLYRAAQVISESGCSVQDVVAWVQVANSVVASKVSTPLVVYGFSASPEGGVLYEFPLKLSVEELVELEWSISEALVDKFEDYTPGVVAFVARPYSDSLSCVA